MYAISFLHRVIGPPAADRSSCLQRLLRLDHGYCLPDLDLGLRRGEDLDQGAGG